MQAPNIAETYEGLKRGFRILGYTDGLLVEDYEFADFLASNYEVRSVPLAAFAQEPPSYRNACFGVVISNGQYGAPLVANYRSLGAPQIIEIRETEVVRWKMTSRGAPEILEQVATSNIPEFFEGRQEQWSPIRLLKAKSAWDDIATQLDFFDLGLLPLLDREVRTKLDHLLRDTVALAVLAYQRSSPFVDDMYPQLFRLIFRLIAAKVLSDRRHPGNWLHDDPRDSIRAVQDFYFERAVPEPVLEDFETQLAAWSHIKAAFHFQNLSVDSLAYVYENTLIAPETRSLFGIHSTPPNIAEYITRKLPFEDLDENERRVFEPFSGHSVFLVAAMQRLRELLPSKMTPQERHQYFVKMLSGIEIDDFAREVARLSLMLADYPNPDGWRLERGDAMISSFFDQELNAANIVVCNPPFEEFSPDDRAKYKNLSSVHKPAAILHKVLQKPPELLGFVLPQVFVSGRGYREVRAAIGETYSSIELVTLPDNVFQHSEAESVLLIASGKRDRFVRLRTSEVHKKDLDEFYFTHIPSSGAEANLEHASEIFEKSMWLPPLQEVWKATSRMESLGSLVSIHRGIEYDVPFRENEGNLISDVQIPSFVPGLHKVDGALEPYMVLKNVFLNVSPEVMRGSAYTLPWDRPKLIVNARRRTRGHWKISASPDYQKLVCYQNFHAIWPKSSIALEVIAAVLNGPVANAFIATREGQRDVRIGTLKNIPFPDFDSAQEQAISALVNRYIEAGFQMISEQISNSEGQNACATLLKLIDAEVLKAYDLAPSTERALLNFFTGNPRPGPVEFHEYFPPTFEPFIPWHIYISSEYHQATAGETLKRLPIIKEDPGITEALSSVE